MNSIFCQDLVEKNQSILRSRYQAKPRVMYKAERQIKGWRRERKIALVESVNPEWEDLAPE